MKGLNGWLKKLEKSPSVATSTLLQELARETSNDESSAIEVGEIIRKDANLTTNIIRVGNSAMFNMGSVPVTTVSRAILNIGFSQIRSICMSIKVLDTVINDNPSDLLLARLATTLHAAAQAKSLVDDKSQTIQEEVYVACLMSSLTELLLLASDDEEAIEFRKKLESTTSPIEKNALAEKHLGVSLSRLGLSLMSSWGLEGLVVEAIKNPTATEDSIGAIALGQEVARCAQFGWDSPEFKEAMEQVSEYKGVDSKDLIKSIKRIARETEGMVSQYGNIALEGQIVSGETKPIAAQTKVVKSNPAFQIKALQEITNLLTSDFNINRVFKIVLLGLNKGVGLERCCIALVDKVTHKMVAKSVQGTNTDSWKETFVMSFQKNTSSFLYQLFEQDRVAWIGSSACSDLAAIVPGEYKGITGCEEFFIAPLVMRNKPIGIIYADMGEDSGGGSYGLSPTLFDGFKLFMQQTHIALTMTAAKQAAR